MAKYADAPGLQHFMSKVKNLFNRRHAYTRYSGYLEGINTANKYAKISINSYTHNMFTFTIRMYGSYRATDILISGYNYAGQHWYSPRATVLGESDAWVAPDITFGYDSDFHLWLAFKMGSYHGFEIIDPLQTYYPWQNDEEDLFSVEVVDSLPDTVQTTVSPRKPLYTDFLSSAIDSTSEYTAATSKAVKSACDTMVKKSGGTMTGRLELASDLYTDSYTVGALDLNNSNILGVNSIYTQDLSDSAGEGIHFYRDETHVDSIHAKNGVLYFTPNRPLGSNGTSQEVITYSTGNTIKLIRPSYLNGVADNTLQALLNTTRANRLAFLPADQIIIEKTTDGGETWVDAGISDANKIGLFSETRPTINLPLLNGIKSIECGIRVTFTAMKYDVPEGTAETEKYQYWNASHVKAQERYNQIKGMYFWVNANSDTINVKLERATGANPNAWNVAFDAPTWGMTGWSGNDFISFGQAVFGGGTTQTANYWNYRLTFMTRGPGGGTTMATSYTNAAQQIFEIRGYGDTWWGKGSEYAANDKLYEHDYAKNATFPASIFPKTDNAASLGASVARWASIYATTFYGKLIGDVTGSIRQANPRVTNPNTAVEATAAMRHYLASSNMTTNKPMSDGHIIEMEWDNTGGWKSQLFVPNNITLNDPHIQWRPQNGGSWVDWITVFDTRSVIPIANGGTGATTAANAWTALGGGSIGKKNSLAASDIPALDASKVTSGTFDKARLPDASTSAKGAVQLSSATNSSSEALAATPFAVKAAYDKATQAADDAASALSAATGALVLKVTYSISNGSVTAAAHVYSAGEEVTNSYAASLFAWSMSVNGGTSWTSIGTGRTVAVPAMTAFGGSVKCDFTPAES